MLINKKLLLLALAGSLCFTRVLLADNTTGAPVIVDVGNTNNPYVSYLVIDDTSLGNSAFEYAWYYSSLTETDGMTPLSGDDLVNAVIAGTTNTAYALTPITQGVGIDSGVMAFEIGSTTSTNIDSFAPDATNGWTYWINGGSIDETYPSNSTVIATNWIAAPNVAGYRILTNGSYDGWTVSGWDTSYYPTGPVPLALVSAVPEPNTAPLLLLSLGTLFVLLRCNSSKRKTRA